MIRGMRANHGYGSMACLLVMSYGYNLSSSHRLVLTLAIDVSFRDVCTSVARFPMSLDFMSIAAFGHASCASVIIVSCTEYSRSPKMQRIRILPCVYVFFLCVCVRTHTTTFTFTRMHMPFTLRRSLLYWCYVLQFYSSSWLQIVVGSKDKNCF